MQNDGCELQCDKKKSLGNQDVLINRVSAEILRSLLAKGTNRSRRNIYDEPSNYRFSLISLRFAHTSGLDPNYDAAQISPHIFGSVNCNPEVPQGEIQVMLGELGEQGSWRPCVAARQRRGAQRECHVWTM